MTVQQRSLVLAGAPLDTGNLGVSALGTSVLVGLAAQRDQRIVLFDHGFGSGTGRLRAPAGLVAYERQGARFSKRLHRQDSAIAAALRATVGGRSHSVAAAVDAAAALLDISGGDSFADVYGSKRFLSVALPKLLALRLGTPLVLLPQTYGPFEGQLARRVAREIVVRATSAWARDEDSFHRMQDLLTDRFDPARHREGVDVAFALPTLVPTVADVAGRLVDRDSPRVGLNVSGLLANDAHEARQRFRIRADTRAVVTELITRFGRAGVEVVLVPHVTTDTGESDRIAGERILNDLGHPERVWMLPAGLGAMETKWCVAQLDWFAGARMHATIAALSSEVPAAGLAYSDKFAGVFARCGVREHVFDLRGLDSSDLLDALWTAWSARATTAEVLRRRVPQVRARARDQFDDILDHVGALEGRSRW